MQSAKAVSSSEHRKLTPISLSEKPKLAFAELVGSAGPESIVGAGGPTVCTLNVLAALNAVVPPELLCCDCAVQVPSASAVETAYELLAWRVALKVCTGVPVALSPL